MKLLKACFYIGVNATTNFVSILEKIIHVQVHKLNLQFHENFDSNQMWNFVEMYELC